MEVDMSRPSALFCSKVIAVTLLVSLAFTWQLGSAQGPVSSSPTVKPAPIQPPSAQQIQKGQGLPGIPPCTANVTGYTPGPIVTPTHYLWIPPVAFSLNRELSVVGIDRGPLSLIAAKIPIPNQSNTPDATATFDAPLNLPNGIVIRQVEAFLEDSDATKNITVMLRAFGFSASGSATTATLASLESNCLTGPGIVAAKGMVVKVDTNLLAYSLNATWVVGTTDYYKLKLSRVRIGYTLQ
jgi:hypothetical protein